MALADEWVEHDEAFPHLSDELLALLDAAGERRSLVKDEVLFRAGDRASPFYVVLSGLLEGIDAYGSAAERLVARVGPRRFGGELNLTTGQPAYVTMVVREAGEAIVLSRDQL